jgi:hypothetical protein
MMMMTMMMMIYDDDDDVVAVPGKAQAFLDVYIYIHTYIGQDQRNRTEQESPQGPSKL